MATQADLDVCYMKVAEAHAALSKGERAKVGACLVTKHGVVLGGCNGMAPGGSNKLEFVSENGDLVTKPQTIHAELSCILKAAKEGVSIVGSTLYVTLSPCIVCSEMIAAAGIERVVYKNQYRLTNGEQNLKNLNLIVEKI